MNIKYKYFYIAILSAMSCGYYLYHSFDIKIEFKNKINQTNNTTHIKEYLPDDMVTYQYTKVEGEDIGKKFGDIEDIKKRGELVVIGKKDDKNALFQIKIKDKKYVGKNIEIAKMIASYLGVRLRFRMLYTNYEDIVDAIENGEGDIGIAKLSYTKERSRKVLYSLPYVISRKMLLINRVSMVKSGKNDINQLLNDQNSVIGTVKSTSYESFIRNIFPKASLFLQEDWDQTIIPLLENGNITAAMRDEIRIKLLLKENPKLLVKLLPIILKDEEDPISAILNQESIGLLAFVDKCIAIEKCQENVDELMNKYEKIS